MENQLIQYIRSDGQIFNLHMPPTRAVMQMTGWGRPSNTTHSVSGPYQHGTTVVSHRLEPRTISMTLVHRDCSRSGWYDMRTRILGNMGINNASSNAPEMGTLKWIYLQNGVYTQRAVDCFLTSGLTFQPLSGWRQHSIQESLEFFCPNPVIYDPVVKTVSAFTLSEELELPVTFPFVLGTWYDTNVVTYAGTWEEYPTIAVTGPTDGFYIENLDTGAIIRLNYEIQSNETVTFDLTYGNKTITNNFEENLLRYITEDSDLAQFAFYHDPVLSGGSNEIAVAVSDSNASVSISYYNRYYGI